MYIVKIVYDPQKKKLRGVSNDGVHGEAWVAFPNKFRKEGASYQVARLSWNGKNYRCSEYDIMGMV